MTLRLSTLVAAPPARTFDAFSDLRRAASRLRNVRMLEVLTDGPIGEGTRFRETRTAFGGPSTQECTVAAFRSGEGYTIATRSAGCDHRAAFRFTPAGEGTRVELEVTSTPRSWPARVWAPVVGWMASDTLRAALRQDLEDLGRAAEDAPTPL